MEELNLSRKKKFIERAMKTLKAKRALFSYIEGFYNRNRIHSSIDYQTPQELEEKILSRIT